MHSTACSEDATYIIVWQDLNRLANVWKGSNIADATLTVPMTQFLHMHLDTTECTTVSICMQSSAAKSGLADFQTLQLNILFGTSYQRSFIAEVTARWTSRLQGRATVTNQEQSNS